MRISLGIFQQHVQHSRSSCEAVRFACPAAPSTVDDGNNEHIRLLPCLKNASVPASNNADLVTNSLDFALISHAVIIFADAGIAISTGVSSASLWVLAKPFSVPVSLPFAPIRRTKEESTVEIERKRKAPARSAGQRGPAGQRQRDGLPDLLLLPRLAGHGPSGPAARPAVLLPRSAGLSDPAGR